MSNRSKISLVLLAALSVLLAGCSTQSDIAQPSGMAATPPMSSAQAQSATSHRQALINSRPGSSTL